MWVRGVVQGVGFRPFVYALARQHGVDGWVRNTSAGVRDPGSKVRAPIVDRFAAALPQEAPPRSRIASWRRSPAAPESAGGFTILESVADPAAYQLVPPDIATCADCRGELLDPADRRHGYPFTNCTNCGPRFTIIEDLPYDRERTTMRHFPLCPACRREYEDPADRRFHAEPNACPVCGPRVRLLRRGARRRGRPAAGSGRRRSSTAGGGHGRRPGALPSEPPPSCCAPARSSRSRDSAASISPATRRTATWSGD